MAFPASPDPNVLPLNVVFPEHYERSKTMIARDFVVLGALIVFSVVFAAGFNLLTSGA
ncbi:MAG TPA: hypothetical protein VM370_05510 [Candidatus Thermoplasmatota archaeon]|nr:hypothetical protein [Candidatus Thermoplasmatota archaeon]